MKLIIVVLLLTCTSCLSRSNVNKTQDQEANLISPDFGAGAPVMVYKTKSDYNNLVPVMLSEDKTEIISYPHPNDISSDSIFQIPIELKGGYLLDNRGIGSNVAFLNLTYVEYSKLSEMPSLQELYNHIVDKDPLLELCNCGAKSAFKDLPQQLNELILANELRSRCMVIK